MKIYTPYSFSFFIGYQTLHWPHWKGTPRCKTNLCGCLSWQVIDTFFSNHVWSFAHVILKRILHLSTLSLDVFLYNSVQIITLKFIGIKNQCIYFIIQILFIYNLLTFSFSLCFLLDTFFKNICVLVIF